MPPPGTVVFYGLAALVLGCGSLVAFSRNLLHSALALLGTLIGVAGLFVLLGADFLGVVQLLVYVGGVLVLVLFAVLLTTRIDDVRASNLSVSLAVAVPVGLAVAAALVAVALRTDWPLTEAVSAPSTARLGHGFLREYLLPFELASLVLLMALVGAMALARRAVKHPPS